MITIWACYFTIILTYRLQRTFSYWSNDLRFYIAYDMLNNEFFMLVLIGFGILLTFVSAVTGIVFVSQNGSTSSLGGIFVFVVVNWVHLYLMIGGHFQHLRIKAGNVLEIFPQPIYLHLPSQAKDTIRGKNLQNSFVNHADIFEYILFCIAYDEERLQALGDPQQISEAMQILFPSKSKSTSHRN